MGLQAATVNWQRWCGHNMAFFTLPYLQDGCHL